MASTCAHPFSRLLTLLMLVMVAWCLTGSAGAATFTPGDLVVYRAGDGSATLASSGTAVFVDEYSPSGSLVQSIALPTTSSGSEHRLVCAGTATSEGQITRSSDNHLLVLTGYDAALGTTGLTSSASTTVPRVVALINDLGAIDTTTDLTDAATGNNPRSATSDGAGNIWFAGAAGGPRYCLDGATTSTQLNTTANLSLVQILSGQLYVSSAKNLLIASLGSGAPETTGQTLTNLVFPGTITPNGFVLLQLGPGPLPDTIYEADNLATINKYSLVGSSFVASGSYALANVTGLVASLSGSNVTLYATNGATIATVTDTSGYNATVTGSVSTIATAGTNTAFRGIAFDPVPSAPAISSALNASGQIGVAFSYQITASNTPTSFNATGLPTGLTVSTTTGLISGTPTASSSGNVSLSATNAGGTGTATLALVISAAPTPAITSAGSAGGQVGVSFSYQITATNSPTSFGASGLPTGLSVNTTTGAITGSPTTAGSATVTMSATNSFGTGTANLSLNILPATPVVTSATTAAGQVGFTFSYQIVGSNSPVSYNATGLPTGLSVNPTSGLISGIPTTVGSSTVTLTATNTGGTGSASLSLMVTPATPVITYSTTATAQLGQTFTYSFTGSNSPTAYGASGLPSGLTLNTATGAISGTPAVAGTFTVLLTATNAGGTTTVKLILTVLPLAPAISSALTASGTVGTPFTFQIAGTNNPTYFSATGLPPGLVVNTSTGAITGTPAAVGTTNVAVAVSNGAGTATATLQIVIAADVVPGITTVSSDQKCGTSSVFAMLLAFTALWLVSRRSRSH